MQRFNVGLCGMSPKDRRMLEIVLTRTTAKRHGFDVLGEASDARMDLALVDANNPLGLSIWYQTQKNWPQVKPVFVSDDGRAGDGQFRIARRMLLSQVGIVLDEVIVRCLDGGSGRPDVVVDAPSTPVGAPSASAQPVVATQSLGPLRALVVDDSATVRGQLDAALSRIGFKVDQAANADEAAVSIMRESFDLMFLDVVMPGIDGYTFCRNVRANKNTKSLPVVMLTSRSSPFDRARGALAGCDTYLTKPIDLKTFHGAVDRVLMKRFKNDRAGAQRRGYKLAAV
jgi:twitching motility two-component system response regulator PilG